MKKVNIFVDMDGVLAIHDPKVEERMYNKGFFLERPAEPEMVRLVKELKKVPEYEIFILSTILDSPYVIPEKDSWLNMRLPMIDIENRIYVPKGSHKADHIRSLDVLEGRTNVLLDDYTENLVNWNVPNALPIKVMNGFNGTRGIWSKVGGERIDAKTPASQNLETLKALI